MYAKQERYTDNNIFPEKIQSIKFYKYTKLLFYNRYMLSM